MILAALLLLAQTQPNVPGSVDGSITQANIREAICTAGYTRIVRPPAIWSAAQKRRMLREAGLPRTAAHLFELDHRVSLSIGGAPMDPANLWLQPWEHPGAMEKDRLEVLLHAKVCSGQMTLREAQFILLGDWWEGYKQWVK